MRRRAFLVLTVLALGVLLAIWLQGRGRYGDPALDADPEPGQAFGGAPLRADAQAPAVSPSPELRGRAGVPAEAARGDVLVQVVGPSGEPIPRVFVTVRANEEQRGNALPTDDRGQVLLKDLPWDGSHRAHFWKRDPDDGRGGRTWEALDARAGDGEPWRAVEGPALTYVAATGLWMHVDVVDASTGAPVRGARLRGPRARIDPDVWVDAPARFFITPEVGVSWVHSVRVDAPTGWVAWDPSWVTATISPYAERVTFTYPLRREVQTILVPRDEDGHEVAADLRKVEFARADLLGWSAEGDAYGRLAVRGVPWLPGEQVRFQVVRRDHQGHAWIDARIPDHPGGRLDLEVELPADGLMPEPESNQAIGLGGGGRSMFRSHHRARYENELIVTVLRRDGSPARGCEVTCGRRSETTNARGQARFENLAPVEYTVAARQAGVLPLGGVAQVAPEGPTRLMLHEPAGGAVEVIVVDGEGSPLPFARLEVATPSGLPWLDVAGTVQRLDPFTDHLGRRVMQHVEPGEITVTARWGSRVAKGTVQVAESEDAALRLELSTPR